MGQRSRYDATKQVATGDSAPVSIIEVYLEYHLVSTSEAKVADWVDGAGEIVLHDVCDGCAIVDIVTLGEVFKGGWADTWGVAITVSGSEGIGSNIDAGISKVEVGFDVEIGKVFAFDVFQSPASAA